MQEGVPQDAEQPGFGSRRFPQLVELLLGGTEGLLRQVLGIRGGTTQPVGVAVKRFVMFIRQPLHIPLIAGKSHDGIPSDT
jgi:hypothetical protein